MSELDEIIDIANDMETVSDFLGRKGRFVGKMVHIGIFDLAEVIREYQRMKGMEWKPDHKNDNSGIDDGVPFTQQQMMYWKKLLMEKMYYEGLSARAIARVIGVSHETAAKYVSQLPHPPTEAGR